MTHLFGLTVGHRPSMVLDLTIVQLKQEWAPKALGPSNALLCVTPSLIPGAITDLPEIIADIVFHQRVASNLVLPLLYIGKHSVSVRYLDIHTKLDAT